ncbi:MAG: hypothetical protein RLZZ387_4337 [Chloroflexota bacterium]
MLSSSSSSWRLTALLYRRAAGDPEAPAARRLARWRDHWEGIHGTPGRKRLVNTRRLAEEYGLGDTPLDLLALLYAIEARFVLHARAIAYAALARARGPVTVWDMASQDDEGTRLAAAHVFAAAPFAELGAAGYGGAELFDFAQEPLSAEEAALVRAGLLAARDAPAEADALRGAYHRLLPKQVRHGLGAYYTPPWLAEYIVEALWAQLPPGCLPRALDPTCGSGAFLVAAMRRLAQGARAQGVTGPSLLRLATRGVAGLDINPVAVQVARANLLLETLALVAHERVGPAEPLELPVFLCDALDLRRERGPGGLPLDDASGALPVTFELVAGNPPWVNWEYLPPAERERTRLLWPQLGLAEVRGKEKAFSKEDVSALFAATACARHLGEGGLLGFVLPQSLLKSSINGRGFRRFRLGADGPPLRVVQVDDLVAVRPFEGVAGRPAVVLLRRGEPTIYPAPYRRWTLAGERRSVPESWPWERVRAEVTVTEGEAWPVTPEDPAAHWADGPARTADVVRRLSGACPYRARAGMFTGGANGVFYVELIEELGDGTLRVRNLAEEARRGVPAVEAVIEREHVYPLLRGREVDTWAGAGARLVICPHTAESRMAAVPPEDLRARAPLTHAYLAQFRTALQERRGFVGWEERFREEAFYACQRIGAYTFAPYKVVWRYIAPAFRCAVVGPGAVGRTSGRPVVPHEKLMLIAFEEADEAYFVCGVLSSAPVRLFVQSRMVETQIAPHVIERLALPRYDASDAAHGEIARLCREGHRARAAGDEPAARAAQRAIERLLPGVLPLTADDVEWAASAIIS